MRTSWRARAWLSRKPSDWLLLAPAPSVDSSRSSCASCACRLVVALRPGLFGLELLVGLALGLLDRGVFDQRAAGLQRLHEQELRRGQQRQHERRTAPAGRARAARRCAARRA